MPKQRPSVRRMRLQRIERERMARSKSQPLDPRRQTPIGYINVGYGHDHIFLLFDRSRLADIKDFPLHPHPFHPSEIDPNFDCDEALEEAAKREMLCHADSDPA